MPYHRLFLHYIGITTLVYPYLVVLFNYFSYTYLFFSILLVVFFVGSYGATFILTPTGILLRYAGWITCGTGVIICLYAFATNHAMLIVLQGMFGVGNGLLRLIEREMIASVTVRELGRMPERHLLRRQFLVTALFAIAGGIAGYFGDIQAVILISGSILCILGLIYSYSTHHDHS